MVDNSEESVDQARLDAGQAILALTDSFGFDALAAGWLHDKPTDAWRYFLVTPMLKSNGPEWIYSRLLRIFRKYPLPAGISPLDVYVIDEAMEMSAFGKPWLAFDHNRSVPGVRMTIRHDVNLPGFLITDGSVIFIRRTPEEIRKKLGNPARRFDKTIQKLAA